jgi:hypothetical protein
MSPVAEKSGSANLCRNFTTPYPLMKKSTTTAATATITAGHSRAGAARSSTSRSSNVIGST